MDMTRVGVVLNSGEVDYFYGSNGLSRITAMQLLVMMSVYDFDDIRCLRASKGDEYFDIDISKLKIVHENNAPVPGVYDKSTKTVTLGNGESFKEMVYYIIHSYQHDYRDDSYNQKSRFVFRIFDDQTSVCLDSNGMNKYGTYIEEDMHIRSVRVEGNAGDGFTLYVSTLSEEAFAEAEPSK